MSNRWRGIVAALLNPDLRSALAEITTDASLSPPRRARALARLEELGLVRTDGEEVRFDDAVLREMLAEDSPVRPRGAERFLDAAGRIDRYPLRAHDRAELLAWVVERAVEPGEVLTEREVNERLARFTGDVAVLRRHLVDHALLERTASGSQYTRPSSDL